MKKLPQISLLPEEPPGEAELSVEAAFLEVFWPEYPRKTAKVLALRSWKKLFPKENQALFDAIMAGLAHYRENEWRMDRPEYIPLAATWLNQRRWEDVG